MREGLGASQGIEASVREICRSHSGDRSRLLDIARDVQARLRCVPPEAIALIARELSIQTVEVESVVYFYSFLSRERQGEIVIRLSDDVIDRLSGYREVAEAFARELGIAMGETTADGRFTLTRTACIGMSDQAPAALVNEVPVTDLTPDRARAIIRELREHMDPRRLVHEPGDGNNAHPLVRAMVQNNLRVLAPIVFKGIHPGVAVRKAVSMSPVEVIRAVKNARLRGRGGAGFPTGMKWEFARAAPGEQKFIVCNADEGEPGTFKDRVILTERPGRVFAGMTIAGYAIGASEGILYLRAEYAYLHDFLEAELEGRRGEGYLGRNACGKQGFDFDIRIQTGAGAYVCGEETALISSAEGARGDPRTRPPFPAQKGYLGYPTVVDNVETLACVTKILHEGAATFCEYGTPQSAGTKVLSISGDCASPGVYEVPFGLTLREVLTMAGGEDAIAVQVGGPSGQMVPPDQFERRIAFEDLATGGSVMVFGPGRDLLEIVHAFLEFFEDESCGYCTPCRVGNVLLREGVERIMAGRGERSDLERFRELGELMRAASRCGLGQTSSNPVTTTLDRFPSLYEERVAEDPRGFRRSFDLDQALARGRSQGDQRAGSQGDHPSRRASG